MKSNTRDRLKLAQERLKDQGVYKGAIDGLWGAKSEAAYVAYLKKNGVKSMPPKSDYWSTVKYFGAIGDEGNLVELVFPYPMKYAGKPVSKTRCHWRIKGALLAVFNELLKTYGLDWIKKHGLDNYDGCFNYRKSRNSSSWSKHAWGVAIDMDAAHNSNKTPWHQRKIGQTGYARMPIEAILIFEKHGFKSGARAWGKDAMHFQFTQ